MVIVTTGLMLELNGHVVDPKSAPQGLPECFQQTIVVALAGHHHMGTQCFHSTRDGPDV